MRLIDADTLKAEFTNNFRKKYHYTVIRAKIDVAPTINFDDLRPKGWWRIIGGNNYHCFYRCSCCNAMYEGVPNYCPNCGAKMETSFKII